MNKNLSICALLALVTVILIIDGVSKNATAQEVRSRTGFGYYDPQIGGDVGNIFYTDITVKLPTGFRVGAGFGLSDVFTKYSGDDVPLFAGFRSIHNFYHMRLLLNKELALGNTGRHIINLGTGVTYIQRRYAEPEVYLNQSRSELYVGIIESNRDQDDAGFLLNGDYGYKVGRFIFGLHSEVHMLLNIGLGGIVVAPQIGLAF